MKYWIITIAFLLPNKINAQFVADFEDFGLEIDDFDNDGDADGGYESGTIFFPNSYNADFDSWTDWAISTLRDTTTEGFLNPLSSFAGSGKASDTYAVASAFESVLFKMQEQSQGKPINGLYLSNNTYAALSMRNGDSFAKKFGGETGDDPDFFKITIKKWLEGERSTDSLDFYLADYRFEDNTQDYIIKDWTYVDLQALGPVDSLEFTLSSSDVGVFGMNTPAYFCIDKVLVDIPSSTFGAGESASLIAYPNPTSDFLMVRGREVKGQLVDIYDAFGNLLRTKINAKEGIDVRDLHRGSFFLVFNVRGERRSIPFIKL